MGKRILIFSSIILVLGIGGFFLNSFLLSNAEVTLSFSVLQVYCFNVIATILIYALIEWVLGYLPNETGYLYLGMLMVKFGIFILLFQKSIFSEAGLTTPEKATLLIPIMVFLAIETIALSKILNAK
ncbi:hypothetical protein C8N26_0444 [Tenacibaculum lutimaris]|uniref:Uncharacterized protein n=1 Tax=Tenacibaculum lutimaris TaxID=285258 RepID=A0A420E4J2_9FLAO|nr:DUF6168 family protein [Tenacibaculum lutimaris]RKF05045.1 hypothetical protein C8N26_0444 [Tenacibaculum lutimaris]